MVGILKRRVVPGALVDATTEAKRIVESAEAEARALMRDAEGRRAVIREEARASGEAAARAECAALLVEAAAARDAMLKETEDSMVDLAMASTERLVGEALRQQPDLVRERVREVLAKARRAQRVTIYVHESDVVYVQGFDGVVVQASESLKPGDCVVDTDVGQFDARIRSQLDALRAALEKE